MAEEFQVTHSAIALWESGERPLSGPTLRLLELYEQELGFAPEADRSPASEFKKSLMKTTSFARNRGLSKLALQGFSSWLALSVQGFLSGERSSEFRQRLLARLMDSMIREFEEMKGLPLKLGQILSQLEIALPSETQQALQSLQQGRIAMHPKEVEKVLRQELANLSKNSFLKWQSTPIAAASIGQVHLAQLKDKSFVVLKIQYPGLRDVLTQDLKFLLKLQPFISRIFLEEVDGGLLRTVVENIRNECDYKLEAETQIQFAQFFAGRKNIRIPKVITELSTEIILCTEYMSGETFAEFTTHASQAQRNQAGETIFRFTMESIFLHGKCNADPHPGNYIFMEDQIAFLDFGSTLSFTEPFIRGLKALILSVAEKNSKKISQAVEDVFQYRCEDELELEIIKKMISAVFAPILQKGVAPVAKDHTALNFQLWFRKNHLRKKLIMPSQWLMLVRIVVGLSQLLARLEARSPWRAWLIALLEGETEMSEWLYLPNSENDNN